jgi:hypothetical protein
MKFKRIRLNKLRNEEWFNFFTEFKSFVEEFFPNAQNIEELFAVFLNLYFTADKAIEKITKSGLTSAIVQLDEKRDASFRGLVSAIKSSLYHYDPTKREAAEKLSILLDHYGNLAVKPYNEETASIYNFVQELRGNYAGAIQTLALEGWVNNLDRENNDFENTVLARNRESADKTDISLLEVRRKTDRCYLDIIERLEALMLINGDAGFEPFVKVLNNNIDRYNNAMKRRNGQKDE